MATETDGGKRVGLLRGRRGHDPDVQVLSLAPMSAVWIAVVVFGSFFLFALAKNIPDTITRVALGLVLAFALDPVVRHIRERFGLSRGLAVAYVGTGALALFALIIAVVGPSAVRQAAQFSTEAPATIDKVSDLPVVGGFVEQANAEERVREWAAELPQRIDDQAVTRLVEALVGGLVSGITVLVVGLAVLADGEALIRRGRGLIPRAHRDAAVLVGRIFYRTIGAYFAGSLVVASLASTFVLTVGLALQVPLAPVAAIWTLVTNLIPQIGGFLGASFFTLLGLTRGPGTALACLALYMIYMNIENHVIAPAIVGRAVDLSAAATMLAALIGAAAAGVPGALIATPLVGTAKALYLEMRTGPPGPEEQEPVVPRRKRVLDRVRARLRRSR